MFTNWIKKKSLFKAAKWAGKMQRQGIDGGEACAIAGRYYGYSASEVARARSKLRGLYKEGYNAGYK